MPTYEYRCRKCKKTFEKLQSMSEKALSKCALCGAAKPERLIGAGAGLIFKGTGFYITDYKNKPASSPSSGKSPAPKEKKKDAPAPKSGKD